MIKNAIIYNCKLPSQYELIDHLDEIEYSIVAKKPTALELSTIGLSVHDVTKGLVSSFQGGYCLQFTKWEKKINAKALKAKVAENVSKQGGDTLNKKQIADIKDQVIQELLPTILPVPKIITCYFIEEMNQLIFDATTTNICEDVIAIMRKSLGSLEAELFGICDSEKLETELLDNLETEGDFTDYFTLGDTVEMKGEGKIKFEGVDLREASTVTEITESINTDMNLTTLQLIENSTGTQFNLVDCYKLKKFIFKGFESISDEPIEDWQAEAYYVTTVVNNIAWSLQNELGD